MNQYKMALENYFPAQQSEVIQKIQQDKQVAELKQQHLKALEMAGAQLDRRMETVKAPVKDEGDDRPKLKRELKKRQKGFITLPNI